MKPSPVIAALFASMMMLSTTACADVVVVAHRDSPLPELSPMQISDLYLGRSRSLPGSEAIIVIDRPRDSPLRERFFRSVNGMTLKQIDAYWARLQFSGQVLPPQSFSETKSLLTQIRSNRMSIGYIDASEADDSVRVVLRLKDAR